MSYSTSAIVLAAGFALGFPLNLWGDEICSVKLCTQEASEGWCFRPVSEPEKDNEKLDKDKVDNDKLLLFMRTNPVASLACFNEQAEGASKAIQTLRVFYGHIGGDVKPDNVDMVFNAKGDLNIGLIDLDDGGSGSLLVDVLHTLAYNVLWTNVPWKEALAAYQAALKDGMKGKKLESDPALKVIRGDKLDKNKCEVWADWDKDKKIIKISESASIAVQSVRKLYEKDQDIFTKKLEAIGTEKGKGYDRKEHSGGSMCAVRFDYLVSVNSKKPGGKGFCDLVRVQFKHQPDWPGPAALVFEAKFPDSKREIRPDPTERIHSLIQHYRPLTGKDKVERDKGNFIDVVKGNSGEYYILRYDRPKMFNVDAKKVQPSDKVAYTKRMLYWLGTVHAQQNKAYASAFIKATAETHADRKTVRELEVMVDEHIKHLTRTQLAAKALPPEETYKCSD